MNMNKFRIIKRSSLAAAVIALSAGSAFAQSTQTTVNVTASVQSTCNMQAGTTDVAFGPIPAFLSGTQTATGQVTLQCNRGATVSIDINNGSAGNFGSGQAAGLRAMKSGTSDYISYHIYQPTGLSASSAGTCGVTGTEWGSGAGGSTLDVSTLYSTSGGPRQINLCGVVGAAPTGGYAVGTNYLDVVTVTATY